MLLEGNFLKDTDSSAFLGYEVVNGVFSRKLSTRNPIEITLTRRYGKMATQCFEVNGIADNLPAELGEMNPNRVVLISIDTMNSMLNEDDYDIILASASSPERLKDVRDEMDRGVGRSVGLSSTLISLLVEMVAGIYPAIARMSPVEALRYE